MSLEVVFLDSAKQSTRIMTSADNLASFQPRAESFSRATPIAGRGTRAGPRAPATQPCSWLTAVLQNINERRWEVVNAFMELRVRNGKACDGSDSWLFCVFSFHGASISKKKCKK